MSLSNKIKTLELKSKLKLKINSKNKVKHES